MFKLLLSAVAMAPVIMFGVSGPAETKAQKFETISFEEYFIEPVYKQLGNCESADLDIFFHDEYVTTHSAEYIAEAISISSNCSDTEYYIHPILIGSSLFEAKENSDVLEMQTEELLSLLKAHGVNPKIAGVQIQRNFHSLAENGRTAILRIVVSSGGST